MTINGRQRLKNVGFVAVWSLVTFVACLSLDAIF